MLFIAYSIMDHVISQLCSLHRPPPCFVLFPLSFLDPAGEVGHHFLASYRMSMMKIIKDYYLMSREGDGPRKLASVMNLNQSLMAVNMDVESLKSVNSMPELEEKALAKKSDSKLKFECADTMTCGCFN